MAVNAGNFSAGLFHQQPAGSRPRASRIFPEAREATAGYVSQFRAADPSARRLPQHGTCWYLSAQPGAEFYFPGSCYQERLLELFPGAVYLTGLPLTLVPYPAAAQSIRPGTGRTPPVPFSCCGPARGNCRKDAVDELVVPSSGPRTRHSLPEYFHAAAVFLADNGMSGKFSFNLR